MGDLETRNTMEALDLMDTFLLSPFRRLCPLDAHSTRKVVHCEAVLLSVGRCCSSSPDMDDRVVN